MNCLVHSSVFSSPFYQYDGTCAYMNWTVTACCLWHYVCVWRGGGRGGGGKGSQVN